MQEKRPSEDDEEVNVKKAKDLFLEQLPLVEFYEKSYMHRDTVTHVIMTNTQFVITASVDGHVKFWKKTDKGIDFVKHFRAHSGPVLSMTVTMDGLLLATSSGTDRTIKVFDILSFDMMNVITLDYEPMSLCWMKEKKDSASLLACSDKYSPQVYFYNPKLPDSLISSFKVHSSPVTAMVFCTKFNTVISGDGKGVLEYWSCSPPYKIPKTVDFELKSDTDLYEIAKSKAKINSIVLDMEQNRFAVISNDRQIRLFSVAKGKMIRCYDESLSTISSMPRTGLLKLDDMEFGRRLVVERELEKTHFMNQANCVFDDSGRFLLFSTLFGIKVVNIKSNSLVALIGKEDSHSRFLALALYQGAPKHKGNLTLDMAASDNPTLVESVNLDPTLFCTAYKKNRFYIFSTRNPMLKEEFDPSSRDVMNETIIKDDNSGSKNANKADLPTQAIIHTEVGDIFISLYPQYAPKAVENFTTHSKNFYYDNCVFHRVIRNFMVQTGDPEGNGTGGQSIWGADFEDEFHPDLLHDRPYMVSMANSGPNTNGSQFFITVRKCPWLDNKHTIFGRVTAGFEVIHAIEAVRTDFKNDRPDELIRITSIDVKQ